MTPRITVLTPVYNGAPYLAECIESVLNQTWTDFEFLIVDDASTDNSLDIIRSYRESRIRVVENGQNLGQSRSLNKGLDLAEGALIARLDQDDVCLPNRLAGQTDYMDRHPDVAVLCSWEITIDSTGRKVRTWEASIADYGDFLGAILLGLCPIWHPSAMFRREAVAQLGNYDPSYGPAEDYELWSRMAANRMGAAVVPEYHLLQRVHSQRQSHLQLEKQLGSSRRAHLNIVDKFSTHPKCECIAALLRLDRDPYGRRYDRGRLRELRLALDEMLGNIDDTLRLSRGESRSLRQRIDRRIGVGMQHATMLTQLPSPLFYPIFFALSPSLLPSVRSFASNIYNKVRYRW